MNKTAAQFAKCILLHTYSHTTSLQLREHKQNFISLI